MFYALRLQCGNLGLAASRTNRYGAHRFSDLDCGDSHRRRRRGEEHVFALLKLGDVDHAVIRGAILHPDSSGIDERHSFGHLHCHFRRYIGLLTVDRAFVTFRLGRETREGRETWYGCRPISDLEAGYALPIASTVPAHSEPSAAGYLLGAPKPPER